MAGFGATLKPTPRERIEQFAQALRDASITVMVRSSSGEDIEAACGQLAVEEEKTNMRAETSNTPTGKTTTGVRASVTKQR
jgi:hypothetical protein